MTQIKFLDKTANVVIRDPEEHCQKHWANGNFYEAQRNGLLPWAYANIPHGGLYIDIGANIGNHSLFMSEVMGGSVIAFEPEQKHFQHLMENVVLNMANVNARNCAISDFIGWGRLVYDETPHGQGGAMMGKLERSPDKSNVWVTILDDTVTRERVTWMKIDAEGSELSVLRGSSKFLKENPPMFISCECIKDSDFVFINSFLQIFKYSLASPSLNHTPTFVWKHGLI